MASTDWVPPKVEDVFPLLTVEYNGSKGWEVGFERHGRPGSPVWHDAMRYMAGCEKEGLDVRLTVTQPPK